jgi:hypothetical protein
MKRALADCACVAPKGPETVTAGRYISHCLATIFEKAILSGAMSAGGRGIMGAMMAARWAAFTLVIL